MTAVDLLAGTIAARLRALPEVERLYPPRPAEAAGPLTASGVLAALADDRAVRVRLDADATVVEVDVAVAGGWSAPDAAAAAADAVRAALDAADVGPHRIVVRVVSVVD